MVLKSNFAFQKARLQSAFYFNGNALDDLNLLPISSGHLKKILVQIYCPELNLDFLNIISDKILFFCFQQLPYRSF